MPHLIPEKTSKELNEVHKPLINNKGQSIIESVIALFLVVSFTGSFLFMIYWGLIFFVSKFQLQKALLCSIGSSRKNICTDKAIEKINQTDFLFKLKKTINITQTKKLTTIDLWIQMPFKKNIQLSDSILNQLQDNK